MKRVLCLFDYVSATGFANVSQNIIRRLDDTGEFEFDIIGINYSGGPYDREKWRGNVWPAVVSLNQRYHDLYGRQQVVDKLAMGGDDYDLIFMIQDTFIVETFMTAMKEAIALKVKQPKIIFYYPIDAPPKPGWVNTVAQVDYPVAYTQYAKDECAKVDRSLRQKGRVIHHGVNTSDFYWIADDHQNKLFRKDWFEGHVEDKFLIMNVNRNQARKDIVRSFMILNELKRRGHKDCHLYMHMAQQDVGGDIAEMANHFKLEFGSDWSCPANFEPSRGVTIDALNHLYNAADCGLSTSMGEGFGLATIEFALTKTPLVIPDNTVNPELMGDNKAFLVPSGDSPSAWILKEMDNDRLRPLMNVEKAADAIERIKAGDKPDVEAAYNWAMDHDWDIIIKQWIALFNEAKPEIVADAPNASMVPPEEWMKNLNRTERRRVERAQQKQAKRGVKHNG